MSQTGAKRHLAVINEITQAKDALGGRTGVWAEFASIWCSLTPVSGSERWYAKEKHATATHKAYTRYIGGVDTKMQFVVRGRTFVIVSIINIGERDKEMIFVIQEEADRDR